MMLVHFQSKNATRQNFIFWCTAFVFLFVSFYSRNSYVFAVRFFLALYKLVLVLQLCNIKCSSHKFYESTWWDDEICSHKVNDNLKIIICILICNHKKNLYYSICFNVVDVVVLRCKMIPITKCTFEKKEVRVIHFITLSTNLMENKDWLWHIYC